MEKWKESTITYAQWFDSASKYSHDRFVVLGEHEGEQWFSGDTILEFLQKPPFDNSVLREEVVALVTKLEQTSIYETIRLLRRMIEQRQQQNDLYPEGHLNLGLAYSVIGDYDGSVDHLERAISLYSNQSVMSREKKRDLDSEDHYLEARYHLGCVLFESKKDFTRAVSELNEAIKLDPEKGNSYYYLGKAILAMIEHETLAKAKNAFKKYLAKGAPLGHEEEVRKEMGTSIKSPA